MDTTTLAAPPGVSAELAAIEARFPGWHCWRSDAGVMHASTCRCPLGGSGTTLEAPSIDRLPQVIAAQIHEWRYLP